MASQSQVVKYKIRLMQEGIEMDGATDGGIVECKTPKDVERLVVNKFNEGWVFVTKRNVGDWGFELFFRKKR